MEDELDLLDSGTEVKYTGKRPAFLTVLCILTFVGAGLSLLYCFVAWVGVSAAEAMIDTFDTVGNGMNNDALDGLRWFKLMLLAYTIGSLLNVVGAFVMMFMRKWGFYTYVIGHVLPLLITMYLILTSSQDQFSLAGLIFLSIFPIGFIIMYGLNYKYLR